MNVKKEQSIIAPNFSDSAVSNSEKHESVQAKDNLTMLNTWIMDITNETLRLRHHRFPLFCFRESKMIPCSKKIPCNSLLEITLYGRRRNINSIESIILYINNDYILIISKRLELVSYNLQVMQDSVVFLWIKLYPCGQVKGVTKLDPLSKLKF